MALIEEKLRPELSRLRIHFPLHLFEPLTKLLLPLQSLQSGRIVQVEKIKQLSGSIRYIVPILHLESGQRKDLSMLFLLSQLAFEVLLLPFQRLFLQHFVKYPEAFGVDVPLHLN